MLNRSMHRRHYDQMPSNRGSIIHRTLGLFSAFFIGLRAQTLYTIRIASTAAHTISLLIWRLFAPPLLPLGGYLYYGLGIALNASLDIGPTHAP